MNQIRKSERKRTKMRLAIQGPSGSGKTYSALLLANGLESDWKKICLIDTENGSGDLYSGLGEYNILRLEKPYSPERFIQCIETCETAGMSVVIVDSLSHEWSGEGGILDIHGRLAGNSFTNWAKISPRHNALVHKILQSESHIISTLRTKQDYVLQEKNGKMVPEKVGMAGVQRDDLSYEFSIVFDIDIKHYVTASKDRTGLFPDMPPFIISQGTGKRILKWCGAGVDLEAIKKEIKEAQTIETLREILLKYPEYREEIEPLCITEKKAIERVESFNLTT